MEADRHNNAIGAAGNRAPLHRSCLSKQTDLPPHRLPPISTSFNRPPPQTPHQHSPEGRRHCCFGPIVIVAVLPSSSRPERLTFRSFAATAISHPPFTHSLSQSVSSSVSPSFSHSIRHSRFRTHSVSFLHLVRFSLGVLGVKATPSLDSDYGLHSGLKTG